MSSKRLDELSQADVELLRAAHQVARRAVNPYSHFAVGAAVRGAEGELFRGTFFESSALPLSVCAESSALAAAITAGVGDFTAVAVVGGDPDAPVSGEPVTPCGGCRQRIYDLSAQDKSKVRVLCANLDLSRISEFTIEQLLPHAFSARDLPKKQ